MGRAEAADNIPVFEGYDYVEFYVGGAKMAAYWFAKALGMDIAGYMGPETGVRDRVSYYLVQGGIKFVVTSFLTPDTADVAGFVTRHGDGVKRWAMRVADVSGAFHAAVSRGAVPETKPRKLTDDFGYVEEAAVRVYDDTEVVFVNYARYGGIFKPGYVPWEKNFSVRRAEPLLLSIDHIVGNVRVNEMEMWSDYFIRSMGFEKTLYFGPGDISTKFSALLSTVVSSRDGAIRNPINESAEGIRMSQIEEYIREYRGTGIQHIALLTDDIISSVRTLRDNGVSFLTIPGAYYDALEEKNAKLRKEDRITEDLSLIRELGILCDLESSGYLLQLFTKPVFDRPTFFFEVIQRRRGASGFGHGNFQALFESIEREQAKRGNL